MSDRKIAGIPDQLADYAHDPKILAEHGFTATYVDIKMQASRSVAQLHLLVHPESTDRIIKAIGAPRPGNPSFFAVSRYEHQTPGMEEVISSWPIDMTYADFKFERRNGSMILKLETPVEHSDEIFDVFGAPNAALPLIVFVAPLRNLTQNEQQERYRRQKFVMQAGRLARDGDFQIMVSEVYGPATIETAAQYIRDVCLVSSRKELFEDVEAQKRLVALIHQFGAWRASRATASNPSETPA